MGLFEKLKEKAIARRQRIVLPEGTEPRTLTAADRIIAEGIATVFLLGKPDEILGLADKLSLPNIAKATIIDPDNNPDIEKYAQLFYQLRKSKGITIADARKKATDPLYLGCLMIKAGDADCQVAGARNATGNVLRAAFQVIKTMPGVSVVSGAFVMIMPEGSPYGTDGIMVFADCAVVPNPTASELAQIAIATSHTARDIAGIEPRVAMLSFSTKGSAKHESVDKVVEATKLVKHFAPNLAIDGELQSDAALIPSVGEHKAPGSTIAGHANVLVFPNLDAGNIAYKLVQRIGNAQAVGPILQGLARPVNDLSRGCDAEDIYKTILITCEQAISIEDSEK